MSWYRALPHAEFLEGVLYRHLGADRYSQEKAPFKYKNYATDDKGIAKGEEETRVQILSGANAIKRTHKIISTSPIEWKVNDKVQLLENGYEYRIVKIERLISTNYALLYGSTRKGTFVPIALTLE
jgi:hypothetical protein